MNHLPRPTALRCCVPRESRFRGLLPTVSELDEFLTDTRPDAYERFVDRLLASPHYGEHWGRDWLDVARYADSNGYTIDGGRSIWKYRDWVIRALNSDLPFDRFTVEQLAGDMLPDAGVDQIIATGFHRNTLTNEEGGTDPEQFRVEAVVDRVSTTGAAFLGLTLGCARCHDHKYDPISQREFYQLFAIFNSADEPSLSVPTDQQAKELPALIAEIEQSEKRLADVDANSGGRQAEWERKLAARAEAASTTLATTTDAELLKLPAPVREALTISAAQRTPEQTQTVKLEFQKIDPERLPLATQIGELQQRKKQIAVAITTTLIVRERKEPRETKIHLRGDFLHLGASVSPDVPSVLPPLVPRQQHADRLDFARWLVAGDNPLTPRVTVNRLWQAYFGVGLVATENDFGLQGDRPTHAELLDWLAGRLFDGGWSLKRCIVADHQRHVSAIVCLVRGPRRRDPYNWLLGASNACGSKPRRSATRPCWPAAC